MAQAKSVFISIIVWSCFLNPFQILAQTSITNCLGEVSDDSHYDFLKNFSEDCSDKGHSVYFEYECEPVPSNVVFIAYASGYNKEAQSISDELKECGYMPYTYLNRNGVMRFECETAINFYHAKEWIYIKGSEGNPNVCWEAQHMPQGSKQ